jgi:hypothetical protein
MPREDKYKATIGTAGCNALYTWLLLLECGSQGQQSVSLHRGAAHSAMPWQPPPLKPLQLHFELGLQFN